MSKKPFRIITLKQRIVGFFGMLFIVYSFDNWKCMDWFGYFKRKLGFPLITYIYMAGTTIIVYSFYIHTSNYNRIACCIFRERYACEIRSTTN